MKTLLVTENLTDSYFSENFLEWQLAQKFRPENLDVLLLSKTPAGPAAQELEKRGYKVHLLLRKDVLALMPFIFRKIDFVFGYLYALFLYFFDSKSKSKEILKYCRQNNVQKIWVVVRHPYHMWVAERLLRSKKIPVYLQISNDLCSWSPHPPDRVSRYFYPASRDYCIAAAAGVAGQSFAADKVLSASAASLYPLPTQDMNIQAAVPTARSDKFIIGILGPIRHKDCFNSLMFTLDLIYWEVDGRKIEIHYWGPGQLPIARTRIFYKHHGDMSTLPAALESCDILYSGYSFEKSYSRQSRLSYPLELPFYLKTSRPIFFQGPRYSSPVKWLLGDGVIFCNSKSFEVVEFNLRKCLYLGYDVESMKQRRAEIFAKLSHDEVSRNLSKFLELEGDL